VKRRIGHNAKPLALLLKAVREAVFVHFRPARRRNEHETGRRHFEIELRLQVGVNRNLGCSASLANVDDNPAILDVASGQLDQIAAPQAGVEGNRQGTPPNRPSASEKNADLLVRPSFELFSLISSRFSNLFRRIDCKFAKVTCVLKDLLQ